MNCKKKKKRIIIFVLLFNLDVINCVLDPLTHPTILLV